MTDQPTNAWDLLAAGGVSRGASAPEPYRALLVPSAADELVGQLADLVRDAEPELILVWDELEQVVLGQFLAARLGVPIARAFDADGLVDVREEAPADRRVLIVVDAVRDPRPVAAMRAFAERQGSTVAGIAVLIRTDELADAARDERVYALVDWEHHAGESELSGR